MESMDCSAVEWNGMVSMECNAVEWNGMEWNGMESMECIAVECNGMDAFWVMLVILGRFAHCWVIFLTKQCKIEMSGSFQRSVSD